MSGRASRGAAIVDPKKQAEYEAWLEQKYGPEIGERIETGRRKMESLSPAERDAMMAKLKDIEQRLAEAQRDGVPPEALSLDPLIERHRAWVASSWGRDCPPAARRAKGRLAAALTPEGRLFIDGGDPLRRFSLDD